MSGASLETSCFCTVCGVRRRRRTIGFAPTRVSLPSPFGMQTKASVLRATVAKTFVCRIWTAHLGRFFCAFLLVWDARAAPTQPNLKSPTDGARLHLMFLSHRLQNQLSWARYPDFWNCYAMPVSFMKTLKLGDFLG